MSGRPAAAAEGRARLMERRARSTRRAPTCSGGSSVSAQRPELIDATDTTSTGAASSAPRAHALAAVGVRSRETSRGASVVVAGRCTSASRSTSTAPRSTTRLHAFVPPRAARADEERDDQGNEGTTRGVDADALDGRVCTGYVSDMSPIATEDRFNMKLAPDERKMLRTLADADGMSESAMLRWLLRQAYRARYGEPKATKKASTKKR